MTITPEQLDALTRQALQASQLAYAPYSRFQVGAALLTAQGKIITGCNVENASYGLSICAERNALTSMVTSGERELRAIVIVSSGGVTPCGACRQFLSEFASCDTPIAVYLVDSATEQLVAQWTSASLLPGAFSLE